MDMSAWDARDYSLAGLGLLASYADAHTSAQQFERGGHETDPLFGENPSEAQLLGGDAVLAALGFALAKHLSPTARRALLGAYAGAEGAAAIRNQGKAGVGRPTGFGEGVKDALPGAALGAALGLALDRWGGPGSGMQIGAAPIPGRGMALQFTKRF
jgi:hypothetical protein